MNKTTHITGNLFTFYRELARIGKLVQGEIAGIPWAGSPSGGWPAYLLGGANPSPGAVKEIAAAMRDDRVPAFWIMESDPGSDTEKMLSAHGIRKINYWTGMCLDASDMNVHQGAESANMVPSGSGHKQAAESDDMLSSGSGNESAEESDDMMPSASDNELDAGTDNLHAAESADTVPPESDARLPETMQGEIRRISSESEMDQWVKLVNSVVMNSSQLERDLFRKLMQNDAFYFYGLWLGDEILSTTLIFVHDHAGGLYFVATDPSHQGKGYGKAITGHAMKEVQNTGAERFVLHSTPQGLRLYRGMGFREVNRYDIYWLLGKR